MAQRPEPYEAYRDDRVFAGLEALAASAQAQGVDCATLALAWVLAQPSVTAVIVGPRRPDQLEAARCALGVALTPDETAAIARAFL